MKTTKGPKHLKASTRRWFAEVVKTYELEPHHVRLLQLAGEAWDRGEQARRALARAGLLFTDRFGQPRARPELAIERDSRIAFARLLRELGLDVSEPGESTRPPIIPGNAERGGK